MPVKGKKEWIYMIISYRNHTILNPPLLLLHPFNSLCQIKYHVRDLLLRSSYHPISSDPDVRPNYM